jgi:hypothetical protein
LQRFQTDLISNTYLSMETLFRFVFHLMAKTEETQSEQPKSSEKKKVTALTDERRKYHLIPSEPKRGHARVAQAITHEEDQSTLSDLVDTESTPQIDQETQE